MSRRNERRDHQDVVRRHDHGRAVLGAGVAALLGGLAWGDRKARVAPRWITVASAAAAVAGLLSLVSFAERGFWSPDVQQQISGNVMLLWPLLTGAALAWRSRTNK
ncbi:MAG: hypothetical protein ABIQ73_01520 [Acidimicrobiales bacterium]